MSGTQFEYFLSLAFAKLGYKVQGTKVTGDYGADLVLTKELIKSLYKLNDIKAE